MSTVLPATTIPGPLNASNPSSHSSPAEKSLEDYLNEYLALPFEQVADPAIAQKVVGASAFFAWDFAKNALQSLAYIVEARLAYPQRNEDTFANLLQLISEECCTDNIRGPEYGRCSHLYPALDAAHAVGFNTTPLYDLLNSGDTSELPPSWQGFVEFQPKYLVNKNGCFAILIHCRELLLNEVFHRLAQHLPASSDYDLAREFFNKHVAIDTNTTDGHMVLARAIADEVITDNDEATYWARLFMQHRIGIYRELLL